MARFASAKKNRISLGMIEKTEALVGRPLALAGPADEVHDDVPTMDYPQKTWKFQGGTISNGCSGYDDWFMWWNKVRYLWEDDGWVRDYD